MRNMHAYRMMRESPAGASPVRDGLRVSGLLHGCAALVARSDACVAGRNLQGECEAAGLVYMHRGVDTRTSRHKSQNKPLNPRPQASRPDSVHTAVAAPAAGGADVVEGFHSEFSTSPGAT